jgi:hypothetical protein
VGGGGVTASAASEAPGVGVGVVAVSRDRPGIAQARETTSRVLRISRIEKREDLEKTRKLGIRQSVLSSVRSEKMSDSLLMEKTENRGKGFRNEGIIPE